MARQNYERFARNYISRFGDAYGPLEQIYEEFLKDRIHIDYNPDRRVKDIIDSQFKFKFKVLGILCFILFVIFQIIYTIIDYFSK